jgi:hypothetical protein
VWNVVHPLEGHPPGACGLPLGGDELVQRSAREAAVRLVRSGCGQVREGRCVDRVPRAAAVVPLASDRRRHHLCPPARACSGLDLDLETEQLEPAG